MKPTHHKKVMAHLEKAEKHHAKARELMESVAHEKKEKKLISKLAKMHKKK